MRHEDSPERDELARLLPPPGDPVLPPGRQRVLEEHLMNQLSDAHQQAPEPRRAPARNRRRLALIGVPVALAVAAGVVVVGQQGGGDAGQRPPAVAGDNAQLTETIDQIVFAANAAEPLVPEHDQFIYIHSQVQYYGVSENESGEGTTELESPRSREVWQSTDGDQGWLIEPETPGGMPEEGITLDEVVEDSLSSPSYDFLSTLPTDPERLLELIYEDGLGEGDSPEERAFSTIGTLLRESLLPPDLGAALYGAAGRIPGVMVVDDVTDALGNEGIAVALESETYDERIEWIFDAVDYTYLGERIVAIEGNTVAEPGTLLGWTGVIEQAVVDEKGQRPGDAADSTDSADSADLADSADETA
ncbi:CU044_5270 family protein [Streptomyces sp. DSM 44915]|uniref:CU044_5270 family protein n=1 Tax=Streptomyces chisholmiae TaxID=3075540 RepID=A0ABU2JTT5_9ACTN|nr:CU044_5270 family protein [Streptomyces sp. DSM 44915]MDT0268176.1 CU044_5270 family protein [Streptomyces sp. DSM 44915]